MPPSLVMFEPCMAICAKLPASHVRRPLTLALSPGRGNPFVDTDHVLPYMQYSDTQISHTNHMFCSLLPSREKGWG